MISAILAVVLAVPCADPSAANYGAEGDCVAVAIDGGRPGEDDSPVLITLAGTKIAILPGETLANGTSCLTYDKAASVRDDLATKNARISTLEAAPPSPGAFSVIVGGVAVVIAAVVFFFLGRATAPAK